MHPASASSGIFPPGSFAIFSQLLLIIFIFYRSFCVFWVIIFLFAAPGGIQRVVKIGNSD
jgi:hypothetical protein